MARKTHQQLEMIDPKLRAKLIAEAKKSGGRVIEQTPIKSWGDVEVGFELVGDFVAIRDGITKKDSGMNPGHLLEIVNANSGELETWGCPAILTARIEQSMAEKGDSLRIVFAGYLESKQGKNPARDFIVIHYPKKD